MHVGWCMVESIKLWNRLCLFLKVCEEEAFHGSRVSLQCKGHLCPKGPYFIAVDTCILTKVRALAAVAGGGGSSPICAFEWSKRLCQWQIFHWFCWLPQATLTSEPVLLLSASLISIFLPTVEIHIKMSFHCLLRVNILGYFLQRDFYVFINRGHCGAGGYLSAPCSWLLLFLCLGLHYYNCGMASCTAKTKNCEVINSKSCSWRPIRTLKHGRNLIEGV